MKGPGAEIYGALSFAIGLVGEEGRVALQDQLSTIIQAHPTFRIEVDAFDAAGGGDDKSDPHRPLASKGA